MGDEPSWVSIPATAMATIERLGDAEAVIDGQRRWTFRDLGEAVSAATAAMIGTGVRRGDRVAIWAPNSVDWIVAALALQSAGASLVPINTRYKGAEVAHILGSSGARLLVTVTGFLDIDPVALLQAAAVDLPALEHVVVLSGGAPAGTVSWADFLVGGAEVPEEMVAERRASIGPDDLSDIMFTSGTTGAPKGVMMTHGQTLRQFADWCDFAGLREGDRYLIVNPFFHMFGYKAGWLACLIRGAVVLPVPVFDVETVLGLIEAEGVTVFPGAPTIYQMLLDHPGLSDRDLSTLRVAVTGAADIPVELIRRMHEELPFESIMTGYGLTEAGTCTGTRPGDDFETIATTAGRTMPDMEVRIIDVEAGADVRPGEAGELVVRGFNVMRGYFEDPHATAAAIDEDGWLHTGDLASMDERGYVRIVGRLKDMFIVGGFNAYPAEIENALLRHEGISQVAVIGVPDERLGEVGRAFVVAAPGVVLDPEEVRAWSRERLANFKVPRHVTVIDELPLNATGKVVKDELRDLAL